MNSATVIDVIEFRESWTHRYPEFAVRGEGILAVLDPAEVSEIPSNRPSSLTISRPDGSISIISVGQWECPHGTVGVFLPELGAEDLPRLSRVSWRPD